MRKALLPMLASLLICGAATAALIATTAHADQTGRKPVLVLAQNQASAPSALDGAPAMDHPMMRGPGRGQMCDNLYAGKAAALAFLEAKLKLNAGQQPLFARWKDVSLDIAKRHEGDCSSRVERLRAGERPDMLEGLNREEEMLKNRLADLQAERPSLTALYAALNPAQKEEFSRAGRFAMGERLHMAMGVMRHGMEHGPEMGRRFGRGPDGGMPPSPPPPPQ